MIDTDLIDIDEETDEEERETELLSASEDFMGAMESSLNEDVLDRQGVKIEGSRFKFTGQDGLEYSITFKEKLFVEAYLTFRGNSVDAIISAGYDIRKKDQNGQRINGLYNRKLASVIAYELLKKPQITSYIKTLYEKYGYTDEAVERELLYMINQQADLKTKAKAIDMYLNLKAKYPAKKLDLTTLGQSIIGIEYVNPTTNKQEPA